MVSMTFNDPSTHGLIRCFEGNFQVTPPPPKKKGGNYVLANGRWKASHHAELSWKHLFNWHESKIRRPHFSSPSSFPSTPPLCRDEVRISRQLRAGLLFPTPDFFFLKKKSQLSFTPGEQRFPWQSARTCTYSTFLGQRARSYCLPQLVINSYERSIYC